MPARLLEVFVIRALLVLTLLSLAGCVTTGDVSEQAEPTVVDAAPDPAAVAADVHSVFWFDGRSLIGNTPVSGGSMPWRPATDGIHFIRIVDDHGRASEREVPVQLLP